MSEPTTPARMPFSWRRAWLIARRELKERVAQRAYRLVLVVGALFVAAAIIVPTQLGGDDAPQVTHVPAAFPALSAGQASDRADALERAARALGGDQLKVDLVSAARARSTVASGDEPLALVITGTVERPRVTVLQRADGTDQAFVTQVVQRATLAARLDGLPQLTRNAALAPVTLTPETVGSPGPTTAAAAIVGVTTLLLYLVGLLLTTAFANGIVSDRAGRIVERLLTAARPEEHLAGKLIGVGIAGFAQIGAWLLAAGLAALAVSSDLSSTFTGVPVLLIAWFPISVVLTYVLYAALTAIFVLPVRKIEDVSGALAIGTMFQVVGYIAATTIIAPGSTVSPLVHALSLVPFFSPLLMLGRIAGGDVPAWELLVGAAGPLLLAALLIRLVAPAYARHAIDAPGGKGLGAVLRVLRAERR